MNVSQKSQASAATWVLTFSLAALIGLTAIAGCASDSGSRSSYNSGNSHAGHNH